MRMRRHSDDMDGEDGEETGIDLAPMLDFVLNLLIFFIITAAFSKELGLTLSSPNNEKQQQQKNDDNGTLFIAVHANGDISIDQRLIDKDAVQANVERFHAEKPAGPVVVVANTHAPVGTVVTVMDRVRLGGVRNVSIAPTETKH